MRQIFPTIDNKAWELSTRYSALGPKSVKVSNNLTELNVVSTLLARDVNPNSMQNISLGTNVRTLLPSCFINCSNLKSVKASANIKDIQQQAFQNCTSLTSTSFFNDNFNGKLNNIGMSAFANTGLVDIDIYLSGTAVDTQIQPYAFAGCRNLKDVTFRNSNYTADYQFANCTALTSVTFTNSHSFVGEHVFENCTSLKSIDIPAKTYGLNNDTFRNCTSLTSVTFNEPSRMDFINSIGNDVFNGTAISTLSLPASITSFTQLNSYALRGMSQLQELHFTGIESSALWTGEEQKIQYPFNKWLYDKKGGTLTANTEYISSNYSSLIEYAKDKHIPIILFRGTASCGWCKTLGSALNDQSVVTWMQSLEKKYLFAYVYDNTSLKDAAQKIISKWTSASGVPKTLVYWLKPDGKEVCTGTLGYYSDQGVAGHLKDFKNWLTNTKYCGDYVEPTDNNPLVISQSLLDSHCFGLNHNVKIFSKTGDNTDYIDDGTGGSPSIIYSSEVQVDRKTVDDFRYGIWYRMPRELRHFADQNHIPVFVEFGSKDCMPCQDFHSRIYKDAGFQSYVKNKKMLFCTVVTETDFSTDQEYYVSHEWASTSEYTAGYLPQMMLYWNQLVDDTYRDEEGAMTDGKIEVINKEYKYYDGGDLSKPNNYNVQMITAWIDQFAAEYVPDSKFNPIPITSYVTDYPRYKIYSNQSNDNYGRYFPCYSSQPPKVYDSYEISVRNSSGVIQKYNITYNSSSGLPPEGTYQYFTMLSTDTSYNSNYDISGIIFKVGQSEGASYLDSDHYNYGEKDRPTYFTEISLTDDKITNSLYNFRDEIYLRDANDDPTTEVDPQAFSPGELVYNTKRTYYTHDYTRSSKSITKIDVYLSAEVTRKQDANQNWYLEPSSTEYVLSSNFFYSSSSAAKIQWLSSFSNLESH